MIKIASAAGKKFAIVGLGKSGEATAAALKASKADFFVWDDKTAAQEKARAAGYNVVDPATVDLKGFEAVILAPGIPLTHPAPHSVVLQAQKAGVPVMGENDLLFRACPDATYIAITGTNGKSTTTALIGHILNEAGRKVQVGGNIGTPALSLEPLGADGIYVLEMSSYQLDLMQNNKLNVAVFLNLTPDHYDRHGDKDGYMTAKKRIISKKTPQTLVLGSDEPEMRDLLASLKSQEYLHIEEISVAHDVVNGVMADAKNLYACASSNKKTVVALNELPHLPGAHNAQNACAAFAACRAMKLSDAEIVSGLKSFPGLVHRQQFIARLKDVDFINDSKATNADAASKALSCYNNIYWIIGGKPKVGGLNGLESLMPRICHTFLIGVASDEFAAWLDVQKAPYTRCVTLDVAVQKAAEMAWKEKRKDAVVLLSPACASFDQFSGFEERGDKFAAFVKALPDKNGY